MIPWKVNKACSTEFRAYHQSGKREVDSLRWVVIHCTQSADTTQPLSARGTAEYFSGRASGGSANLVVGDLDCFKTLPDDVIPWGAPPLNSRGFHIEISGRAEWSRARWLLHSAAIRRAAYKASLRCAWYGIPAKYRNAAHLKAVGPTPPLVQGGITTHVQVSIAFKESTHTDPGAGFPIDWFLRLVNGYLRV